MRVIKPNYNHHISVNRKIVTNMKINRRVKNMAKSIIFQLPELAFCSIYPRIYSSGIDGLIIHFYEISILLLEDKIRYEWSDSKSWNKRVVDAYDNNLPDWIKEMVVLHTKCHCQDYVSYEN